MCGGVGTDHDHAAQCDDQMLAGNGAAPRVWGAGCGHWLALARHKLLPSSATLLLLQIWDNPHHVISVLQTLNNYLPSRLSSPGTTLAGGASARYSGQLMLSFYYLTFRQKWMKKWWHETFWWNKSSNAIYIYSCSDCQGSNTYLTHLKSITECHLLLCC